MPTLDIEYHTRGGTRTHNLLLRREAPYPLGHTSYAEMELWLLLPWQTPNACRDGPHWALHSLCMLPGAGTEESKMVDATRALPQQQIKDTLPEWSKGVDSSSTSASCVGSNPTGVIAWQSKLSAHQWRKHPCDAAGWHRSATPTQPQCGEHRFRRLL